MVQDSNGLGHAPVYESSEMEPYVWVSSEVEGLLWYVRYKVLGGFSGCEKGRRSRYRVQLLVKEKLDQ